MSLARQPGTLGALARFFQRTYVAEFVALGLVAMAFALVSVIWKLNLEYRLIRTMTARYKSSSLLSIECSTWTTCLFSSPLPNLSEFLYVRIRDKSRL